MRGSQRHAVEEIAVRMCCTNDPNTAMQGQPGTGKTHVSAFLLRFLLTHTGLPGAVWIQGTRACTQELDALGKTEHIRVVRVQPHTLNDPSSNETLSHKLRENARKGIKVVLIYNR